jgi:hypothetical protein
VKSEEELTMISPRLRTFIYVLLVFLVILDIVLSTTCLLYPEKWFSIFHGAPYIDPQGLLKRTGAVWVAFTLLQLIAVFRWEKEPWWLVLIAGVRLTELFSDWTYMYVAQSMTTMGRIGLFIAPPGNLVFGWFLIWAYLKIMRDRQGVR